MYFHYNNYCYPPLCCYSMANHMPPSIPGGDPSEPTLGASAEIFPKQYPRVLITNLLPHVSRVSRQQCRTDSSIVICFHIKLENINAKKKFLWLHGLLFLVFQTVLRQCITGCQGGKLQVLDIELFTTGETRSAIVTFDDTGGTRISIITKQLC